MIFNSGLPFNITIGRDLNGDLLFTDRPSFASAASCGQTNIVWHQIWGLQSWLRLRAGAADPAQLR